VGVVSRRPGILMGGPTADVYPVYDDLDAVRSAQSRPGAVSAELEEIQAVLASPSAEELDAGTHAFLLDRLAVLSSDDPVLSQMKQALEDQIDQWSRGNVNVALVGRVPVRVVGVVRIGDYLTSSEIPGVAMAMTHAGPTIGVALEDYNGNAEGTVVAVIQPGWYGAALTNTAQTLATGDVLSQQNAYLAARLEALEAENLDLQNRLAALEHLVASGQN
ncbi:MAG: hypothetical protein JW810_00325, partial [Sedimentisphaerales bacterium]|nr:hypothetical protein [Sedimentisphaerales bacterium]